MPVSLSCARRALRRCVPSLPIAVCTSFLERLRAKGALTKEEAERVARQPTDLEKSHTLVEALCEKRTSAAFELLRKCLAMEGRKDLEEFLSKEYESALRAPPDVTSSSYTTALSMALVPDLPSFYLPRESFARELRDLLMEAEGERRLVAVTGGPGMGKTSLTSDVVRNEELFDHFKNGVVWFNIGPNRTAKESIHLLKRRLRDTDTAKTLLILDDVWNDEFLSSLTDNWKEIRVIITSRKKNILSSFKDKCVKSLHLKKGFTFQECRHMFCRYLNSTERGLPLVLIDELCAEFKGWPLGICTIAVLVKCDTQDGQTIEVALDQHLEAVRNRQLDELKLYSDYAYEEKYGEWSIDCLELSQPVSLSISQLNSLQLECVTILAVLMPEKWVTVEVLRTIWSHLDIDFTQDIRVEQLLASSLTLSSHEDLVPGGSTSDAEEGSEWKCKLHDFFRSVILQDIDENNLVQKHRQIVSNYENACAAMWGKLPEDGYIISHLCHHLEQAGRLADIPRAFSDFFFVEKMFRTCGLNTTLDNIRHYYSCFETEADKLFRDKLISTLESIVCFGRNPRYRVSFAQTILQMSPSNPLVCWAEDAIRSHPQLLSHQDSRLWRLTSPRINRFRRQLRDLRFSMPRSIVANDTTYEVACIALDMSKKLLVVITVQNQLVVCDADSLDCKISGYRISSVDSFVQKVCVFSDNRRLLLLTDKSVLMCGHLRFSLDKLSQLAPHGDDEEVPVQNILPEIKVQNFDLRGSRLAVIDVHYNVRVFDLKFVENQNDVPSMTIVVTILSNYPKDCFARDKIAIQQLKSILSDLKIDLEEAAKANDMFEKVSRSIIYNSLSSFQNSLNTLYIIMFETIEKKKESFKNSPLRDSFILASRYGQRYYAQHLLQQFSGVFERIPTFMKTNPYIVASYKFWFKEEMKTARKKLARLSQALMPPKIDMTQTGSILALSTNLSSKTVKIFDISNDNQRMRLLKMPAEVTDLKFFVCPKSSKDFIAIAYENIVGIWSVQDEVPCQQLTHDHFVLNFAIEQELCLVGNFGKSTKWQLCLPSDAEQLTESNKSSNQSMLIAKQPIFLFIDGSLGQLHTSGESSVGCVMSGKDENFPGVMRVADKLFLASNFREALILLEPHSRTIALIDMDNKVKSRAYAACEDAIFVGGAGCELVRYQISSDGQIGERETLSKFNPGSDDITALEYSPRGNLLIGMRSGTIRAWNERNKFHTIGMTNGIVVFLVALKKRSEFVSVSVDKRIIEIRVWSGEATHEYGVRFTSPDPSCTDFDASVKWINACRPTISKNETFLAMLSLDLAEAERNLFILNLRNRTFVSLPHKYYLVKVLFHPKDDRLILLATKPVIHVLRLRIDSDLSLKRIKESDVLNINEGIKSISIYDSDHIIISSEESVTAWKLSAEGDLSDGRLILSRAQVKGEFLDTFVSRDALLCVTEGVNNMAFHRAFYPVVLQSDFLS